MRQLYFVKKGKLEWREVAKPAISDGNQAVVRPFAVAKCDLDDAFLFNNINLKVKIGQTLGLIDPHYNKAFGTLLSGPFPFGHECVAEVVEIGESVRKVKVGDVVTVPFQISCGACLNCSNGLTSVCERMPPVSTYGFGKHLEFGGAMSDFIKGPFADAMLLKLPSHINPVHLASLADNIPDAYRHLKSIEHNPHQKVLVISGKAKSVGIYALMLAKAMGVAEVDYADNNAERQAIAHKLKANNIYASLHDVAGKYDLVIDASASSKGLQAAFRSVRNFGTVSSSGIYIRKQSLSLVQMYAKGVTFQIGFANARADAERVLELMKKVNIPFDLATTRLDSWENSVEAFLTESTKVIVQRERMFDVVKQ
jgi:threonine dehydrogenase-like Zn-dependent dehydrogenase